MTTATKIILVVGGLGVVYVVAKQLAPQPKNPISSVIDSATGLIKAFSGDSSSAPATPEQQFGQAQPYSIADAAYPDELGYGKGTRTQLAPQNTMTRAQAALIGIS